MEQEMRYVYEVYLAGSFSKAAEKLYLSQPALSIAVRKVEKELGTALFDRSCQPIRLTPAGQVYVRHAEHLRTLEEGMQAEIDDLSALKRGHLRVGGSHYVNSCVLPPVLDIYAGRYPGITLTLKEATSYDINRQLAEGHIDIMFSALHFDERFFHQRPVFNDHVVLVVPKKLLPHPKLADISLSRDMLRDNLHMRRDCPQVDLSVFQDSPFLLLTQGNNLHERALALCRDAGFEPRVRMMVEQFTTAYALASAGLGLCFASTLLILSRPRADVNYFKLAGHQADRFFSAVMRKDAYIPKPSQAFLDVFSEYYQHTCPI